MARPWRWVREKHMEEVAQGGAPETELCQFFEDYEKEGPDAVLPPGVYTLAGPGPSHHVPHSVPVYPCTLAASSSTSSVSWYFRAHPPPPLPPPSHSVPAHTRRILLPGLSLA